MSGKLKLFTLNYKLEADDDNLKNIELESSLSLTDADIVLIDPVVAGYCDEYGSSSWPVHRGILYERWQEEIHHLLDDGKIIFCLLRATDDEDLIASYSFLDSPKIDFLITGRGGEEIKMAAKSHPMAKYYDAFKGNLRYEAYFASKDARFDVFLVNNGGYPVGFALKERKGLIVFIPPPDIVSVSENPKKLIGVLRECAADIKREKSIIAEPPPSWVEKLAEMPGENKMLQKLESLGNEIRKLEKDKSEMATELEKLQKLRCLLWLKGTALEEAVLDAFMLMGFIENKHSAPNIDCDILVGFPNSDARVFCEVEGKDNDAINVDKARQLGANIEDYNRVHGVFPVAILVGNPYRLLPPDERKESFTEKVKEHAQKRGYKLLTTIELFNGVFKILQCPNDKTIAEKCRNTIMNSADGEEIKFP